MNSYLPIGERIAIYRRRRGLSQMRLGGLIGRSEDWVSKVERGDLPIDRMSVLVRVAEALRVQLGDLIRDPIAPEGAGRQLHEGIVDLRRALIRVPVSAAATRRGEPPPDLDTLRRDVTEIHQLRAQVRHADSLIPLPGLLAKLQLATTFYSGDQQADAFGCWSRATSWSGGPWVATARTTSPGSPPTARCTRANARGGRRISCWLRTR